MKNWVDEELDEFVRSRPLDSESEEDEDVNDVDMEPIASTSYQSTAGASETRKRRRRMAEASIERSDAEGIPPSDFQAFVRRCSLRHTIYSPEIMIFSYEHMRSDFYKLVPLWNKYTFKKDFRPRKGTPRRFEFIDDPLHDAIQDIAWYNADKFFKYFKSKIGTTALYYDIMLDNKCTFPKHLRDYISVLHKSKTLFFQDIMLYVHQRLLFNRSYMGDSIMRDLDELNDYWSTTVIPTALKIMCGYNLLRRESMEGKPLTREEIKLTRKMFMLYMKEELEDKGIFKLLSFF